MNAVATTTGSTSLAEDVPVLRITPASRWWVLPVGELWAYRELLYFFVWRDIKVRYKQTAIGIAWVVLQPLLTMAVFTLFFGRLWLAHSEGLPYPIFYFAALVPWTYFSGALQHATNIIVEKISKSSPKCIFQADSAHVVSCVRACRLRHQICAFFSAMTVGYRMRPGLAALWLPVMLILAIATALGVGLWLSALNALYRDVRYVMPFFIQFWMFASPVALSEQSCSGTLALALRPQSPGRGYRRLPLGPYRSRSAPWPASSLASAAAVLVILLGGLLFSNAWRALLPTVYESMVCAECVL